MYYKVHKSYREVVGICDSELVGKYFEEDRLQLDVKESFFKGEKVSEKELIEIMIDLAKEDATFNIIGKKSINCAVKAGLIPEESVGEIQGIPFALVLI